MPKPGEKMPYPWVNSHVYNIYGGSERRIWHADVRVCECIGSKGTRIFWAFKGFHKWKISYIKFCEWKLSGRDE